jgi:antitoxin StbD
MYNIEMETLLSNRSIGISDLRDAPARAFEQADDGAVVVLNHNKPAGYLVSTKMMASLMEMAADRAINAKAASRLPSIKTAKKITLDDL